MTEHIMSAHLSISEPHVQVFVALGVTEPGHIEIVAKGFKESDAGALGVAEMLEDAARAIKSQIDGPTPSKREGESQIDYARRLLGLDIKQQEQKPRPRFNPQPRGAR